MPLPHLCLKGLLAVQGAKVDLTGSGTTTTPFCNHEHNLSAVQQLFHVGGSTEHMVEHRPKKKKNKCAGCSRTLGNIIGWSSSGFYLGSRGSQIWKNHSRQSAEGLSLAMFACAITANLCYGLGILIRAYSWQMVRSSAPWILGSLGTVSLDLVIFTQVTLFY